MKHSGHVNINGDGNAVGNNNRVLVDKRIFNTITHQPPPNGQRRPEPEGSPGNGINPIGIAFCVFIGIAIAAWKFAVYADEIYLAGMVSSLLIATVQLLSAGVGLSRQIPSSWIAERVVGVLAAGLAFMAFYRGRQAFPEELSQIAAAANGWQGFMCNLSDFGQQVATFHLFAISLLALPGLFFVAINSVNSLAAIIFFATGWRWAGRTAILAGGRGMVFVGILFVAAALASQTSVAFALWQNQAFTAHQNPFSMTTKGIKLCPTEVR
jgi:hypothetical protein